jgi:hypothetical protein
MSRGASPAAHALAASGTALIEFPQAEMGAVTHAVAVLEQVHGPVGAQLAGTVPDRPAVGQPPEPLLHTWQPRRGT